MIDTRKFDSFLSVVEYFEDFDFEGFIKGVTQEDIKKVILKKNLDYLDFLKLLSPKAKAFLEPMAQIAKKHYIRHFGRVVQLYQPLYISNYCSSECLYCGFSKSNKIARKQLTPKEIEFEAKEIAKSGIKHILMLTGEAKKMADLEYLKMAITILKRYFSSIALEVYPMDTSEYIELKECGADSLTVYQEVYDKKIYKQVHIKGEKKDYSYRLQTPQRGAEAGFRAINIGALFGLGEITKEAFLSGLHAKFLMDKYSGCEISLSLPRINRAERDFKPLYALDDKTFVQIMLAYRLFMPNIGINISTRERAEFRDNLLGLGVTKLSAGSKTDVGGYALDEHSAKQFEISDNRSVKEVVEVIRQKGFQPVFKDWTCLI